MLHFFLWIYTSLLWISALCDVTKGCWVTTQPFKLPLWGQSVAAVTSKVSPSTSKSHSFLVKPASGPQQAIFNKVAADTHAGQEHDIYLPEGPQGSDLLPGAELPPVGHLPGPEEKLSPAVVDPLVQNPPGSHESGQSRDLISRHRHKETHAGWLGCVGVLSVCLLVTPTVALWRPLPHLTSADKCQNHFTFASAMVKPPACRGSFTKVLFFFHDHNYYPFMSNEGCFIAVRQRKFSFCG